MRWLTDLLKRDDGPTAVEYAVMLALIVLVCVGAIRAVGSQTSTLFTTSNEQIESASH